MKIILVAILLFFINSTGICQTLDGIKYNLIQIRNQSNKTYSLGSAKQLIKAFGKPSIKKERDEVLGGYGYFYRYTGFETYFNEQDWETTTITGKDYKVILDDVICQIGEDISKLRHKFPASYKSREKREKNNNGFWLSILHNKSATDSFIFIKYDDLGHISEITITNDNS